MKVTHTAETGPPPCRTSWQTGAANKHFRREKVDRLDELRHNACRARSSSEAAGVLGRTQERCGD